MFFISVASTLATVPVALEDSSDVPPTVMLLTVVALAAGKAVVFTVHPLLLTVTLGVTPAALAGPKIFTLLPAAIAL